MICGVGCAASVACGRSLTTDFGDIAAAGFGGSGASGGSVSPGGSGGNLARGGTGGAFVGNGGNPVGGQGGFVQGGSGGQGGTTAPAPAPIWECEAPVPLGNGFVGCASGMIHRPRTGDSACLSELPRAQALDAMDFAVIEQNAQLRGLTLEQILALLPCVQDSDCLAAPNGYCEVADSPFTDNLTQCAYGCVTDAECADEEICLCGSPAGTCVSASCRRDTECGSGVMCTSHVVLPGCEAIGDILAFACQSLFDQCGGDGDCGFERPYCALAGVQRVCSVATGCF